MNLRNTFGGLFLTGFTALAFAGVTAIGIGYCVNKTDKLNQVNYFLDGSGFEIRSETSRGGVRFQHVEFPDNRFKESLDLLFNPYVSLDDIDGDGLVDEINIDGIVGDTIFQFGCYRSDSSTKLICSKEELETATRVFHKFYKPHDCNLISFLRQTIMRLLHRVGLSLSAVGLYALSTLGLGCESKEVDYGFNRFDISAEISDGKVELHHRTKQGGKKSDSLDLYFDLHVYLHDEGCDGLVDYIYTEKHGFCGNDAFSYPLCTPEVLEEANRVLKKYKQELDYDLHLAESLKRSKTLLDSLKGM